MPISLDKRAEVANISLIKILTAEADKGNDLGNLTANVIPQHLIQAATLPIFWQFLGLGYTPAFLKRLNTMGGRAVDNVGLFEIPGVLSLTDEEFYDKIIEEFVPQWIPAARAAGILTR
jgi:vWA found in TerF C terminus